MKLNCHRGSLSSALQIVSGAVPARTPKEILKNVKLQVTDSEISLIGTDLETSIRHVIKDCESDQSGEVLLHTARLQSILREIPDERVALEVTPEALIVKGGRSRFRLAVQDPSEFPTIAAFSEENYHLIDAATFREMIRRTIFSCDVESTRYALGGVLVDLGGDSVTMAATDSRRLSVISSPCTVHGTVGETNSPVIPHRAMSLLEKSLAEGDEQVKLAVRGNDVVVQAGQSTLYSRVVDGRFPRYQDVIPKEFNATIELVAGPFYSTVRQAQIVTDQESRGVDFEFSADTLTLVSKAPDIGESRVEHPISYSGSEMKITFDPRFLAEFLRVLDAETQVHFCLIDPQSAAVFKVGESYTYVIMPLAQDH
ncbi:MAG: DNA polymerase III subunit beta [Planctomycetota bacterium]|nr:DNA polymerase III subunit beta [Planctomycetota bacterium]MDA1210958.1 DNA polymerase III subunit beta [Planctomycetota bacterium]